jgi:DNA-binding transcriptional ArsR family regulator
LNSTYLVVANCQWQKKPHCTVAAQQRGRAFTTSKAFKRSPLDVDNGRSAKLQSFCLNCGPRGSIVSKMAKHDPDLSRLFHALADPTRRAMLAKLAQAPARITDLAGPTGLRLPTVMRHISVLEEAGLIKSLKEGRTRTCALVPEALNPMQAWLDEQQTIWEARLDRLDRFVMKAMKERKQ